MPLSLNNELLNPIIPILCAHAHRCAEFERKNDKCFQDERSYKNYQRMKDLFAIVMFRKADHELAQFSWDQYSRLLACYEANPDDLKLVFAPVLRCFIFETEGVGSPELCEDGKFSTLTFDEVNKGLYRPLDIHVERSSEGNLQILSATVDTPRTQKKSDTRDFFSRSLSQNGVFFSPFKHKKMTRTNRHLLLQVKEDVLSKLNRL